MKQKSILAFVLLALMCVSGCAGEDIREQGSSNEETVQETSQPIDEPVVEQEKEKVDQFSFGYATDSELGDMYTYTYDGEYIEVPFRLKVESDTGHDLGFFVFINGILQKYSIKEEDREESTMQLFALDQLGEKEYTFLIKPNIGKQGDKLSIYVCGIVYPSFQPESEEQPSYQYFGQLSQVVPEQVRFTQSVSDNSISFVESENGRELSEEVVNAIEMLSTKSLEEHLEDSLYTELYQKSLDETVMKGEDGKIHLKLNIYGGVEGEYCTTIFVNNQPVQIDGKDAVHSVLQANTMSEYEFDLDLSGYEKMNTIYAITVPADDAYLEYRSCEKSSSRLLINQ